MTNRDIEMKMHSLVKTERKITNEILMLIREAERRRLYLEGGFSSIYDWLIRKYGYSQSAANRRIQASRLLDAVPDVSRKLVRGTVNLTTLTQVQSTLRREEKRLGLRVSTEVKQALVEKIEGQSSDETQRLLIEMFPEAAPKESLRICSVDEFKLTVVLDQETVAILKRAKELLSHRYPDASWVEVIRELGKSFLKAKDPLKKKMTRRFAGAAKDSAELSKSARRNLVLKRAGHACQYVDRDSGRKCGSRYQVEIDHVRPRALGGTDELENLRCLCRRHNLLMAERNLGREFMSRWRKKRAIPLSAKL